MSEIPPYQQPSNYPRPNLQGSYGSMFLRPPGVYIDSITDAWALLTKDLGSWVVTTLLYFVLAYVVAGIQTAGQIGIQYARGYPLGTNPPISDPGTYALEYAVILPLSSIGGVLYTGMQWVGLKQIRTGQVSVGDLFGGFSRFGSTVAVWFLYSLAVIVATLLFILPGIYLAGALSLAPLLVLDRKMGPIDALRLSARTLGSKGWLMFLVLFFAAILACLGVIACCIGVLITMPLIFLVQSLHYHYYFDQSTEPAPQPLF